MLKLKFKPIRGGGDLNFRGAQAKASTRFFIISRENLSQPFATLRESISVVVLNFIKSDAAAANATYSHQKVT